MNYSENGIALKLRINDYSDSVKVVDLIKAFVLIIHLLINAVNRLYTSFKRKMYFIFGQFFRNDRADVFDYIQALTVFVFNRIPDLFVSYRVKVHYSEIFKFLLDFLNSETVS